MNREMIEIPSINHEVYDRLRQKITSGNILPGEKISIRSIAQIFGVSTMPVREALRKLQAEGFVTFHRRSVIVNQLSVEEVKQIFQIRLRLELLAAEWALDQVTNRDLHQLDAILQVMKQNISVKEWRKQNRQFHIRFYECAQSPHLIELIKNVWDKVEPYMTIYTSTVEDFAEAHKQHTEIFNMIQARNLSQLLQKITEHLGYTSHIVSQALTEK